MGLLETLIGQPPNADVNADSDAFSSPDDAVDEEQGQFVQDFLQVFQLALNASPYFQAQMQPSESSHSISGGNVAIFSTFAEFSGIAYLYR